MNSTTSPSLKCVCNGVRLLTSADVAVLPDQLPSGAVRYELHDGRLIVLPPPTAAHGRAQAHFVSYLFMATEQVRHGRVYCRVGIILRRDPDHVLGPDAAFLAPEQLPPDLSPEDYLTTAPALVIEILERWDARPEVDTKVRDYLAAGVVLVWVADPDARTVTAYRTDQPPVVFAATDTLTAEPVIPGFAVLVGDLLPA